MSKASVLLIVGGGAFAALLASLALGAFNDFIESVQAFLTWVTGVAGLVTCWALAAWALAPNFVKSLIARLIRLAPNVPNHLKRRAIKNEIESSINKAFEQFNREGAGFIDCEVSISWLNPGESARELFFESGKAYVKLDYATSAETNLVEAALLICRRGLLPETRQYVPRQLMRAIDLQFVDQILQRQRAAESRAYFLHEVMDRETEGNQETQRFVDRLQLVSQHGLFTRVLLPELRDYPVLALEAWPQSRHAREIESYLDFVEATVKSREKGTTTALVYVGQVIRTAIVLVGMPHKLESEGTRPYVKRTALNEQEGAQTVYLLGYNRGVKYVELIARETQVRGLVASYGTELYDATVRDRVERHKLARLIMQSGEGSRFLTEHPSNSEWPDIEDDIEWREILAQVTADNAEHSTKEETPSTLGPS